jgi:hypothetical protein
VAFPELLQNPTQGCGRRPFQALVARTRPSSPFKTSPSLTWVRAVCGALCGHCAAAVVPTHRHSHIHQDPHTSTKPPISASTDNPVRRRRSSGGPFRGICALKGPWIWLFVRTPPLQQRAQVKPHTAASPCSEQHLGKPIGGRVSVRHASAPNPQPRRVRSPATTLKPPNPRRSPSSACSCAATNSCSDAQSSSIVSISSLASSSPHRQSPAVRGLGQVVRPSQLANQPCSVAMSALDPDDNVNVLIRDVTEGVLPSSHVHARYFACSPLMQLPNCLPRPA